MSKQIGYYGKQVTVPEEARFIATDADGTVWWYETEPEALADLDYWYCSSTDDCIDDTTYEGDWKDSLMEID